jgi:hypothetical protein
MNNTLSKYKFTPQVSIITVYKLVITIHNFRQREEQSCQNSDSKIIDCNFQIVDCTFEILLCADYILAIIPSSELRLG